MSTGFVFLDLRFEPFEVGLLAHHVLVLSREQDLRVRIFFQHRGKRLEQNLHALFGGEARRHADDGAAGRGRVRAGEVRDRAGERSRQVNRRQDGGQFVAESREIRGVVGVVLGIRHDVIREQSRHIILEVDDRVDEAVEKSGRQVEVAVIGQDGGLAKETRAESHAGRVELREVELRHIVLGDQFGCDEAKGRREHALADAHRDRDADDLHAIHRLLARQRFVVLRRHHRDLMAAAHESARQAFGVDGESRSVRAVVGEDGQDFHKRGL